MIAGRRYSVYYSGNFLFRTARQTLKDSPSESFLLGMAVICGFVAVGWNSLHYFRILCMLNIVRAFTECSIVTILSTKILTAKSLTVG